MSVDAKYWTEAKATGGGRNGTSGLVNGQLTVTMASPKELGGSGLGKAKSWALCRTLPRSMPMSASARARMAASG
jgi:hypothetical protein